MTSSKQLNLFEQLACNGRPADPDAVRPFDASGSALRADDEPWLKEHLDSLSESDLESLIAHHNALYNEGHTTVSDLFYDRIVERLRAVNAANPILNELTSPQTAGAGKVYHDVAMLSLLKAKKGEEFKNIESWLKDVHGDFLGTPKIDGLACSIQYDGHGDMVLASTRGNGRVGEDITGNVRYIQAIPKHIDIPNLEIRGEVYMPLSAFRNFDGEKISARNLAVGGLKQKDPRETARYHLGFFAYEAIGASFKTDGEKFSCLNRLGFTTVQTRRFAFGNGVSMPETMARVQAYCREMAVERDRWDFDADGLVFKVDDNEAQRAMGMTAHHPKCAIAFKFACDCAQSTLRAVSWQVAKGGALTPVAVFDEVELAGAKVRRATLSNAAQVEAFPTCPTSCAGVCGHSPEEIQSWPLAHLKLGAAILVSRRGDVIPHVEYAFESSSGLPDVALPTVCPSCSAPVRRDGLFLRCTNPDSCPATGQALIENFIKVVGIMGFGEKIIAGLYDAGFISTPADLYALSPGQIAVAVQSSRDGNAPDADAVLPNKLYDAIQNARRLRLETFLEGLSIPMLGKVTSRSLCASFRSLDEILDAGAEVIARAVSVKMRAARGYAKKIAENEAVAGESSMAYLTRCIVSGKDQKDAVLLAHAFPGVDALKSATVESIRAALDNQKAGDKKTPAAIVSGLERRRPLIERLLKEITIVSGSIDARTDLPFSGMSFLFTGTLRSMKREEAENRVKALGADIAGSVTRNLSVLVSTTNATSKWKKAETLNAKGAGIRLWSEDEFLRALEGGGEKI